MNFNAITILTTVLFSFALTITGGYFVIDNLLSPQGYLFEGVVLTSLGIIGFMLIAVASAVGKAIMNFREIYIKQLEMQQEMIEFYNKSMSQNQPKSIGEILSNLGKFNLGKEGSGSITITDLDTGKTSTTPLGGQDSMDLIREALKNTMSGKKGKKELQDMTLEELEKELGIAVTKDNYERALEIRKEIKKRSGDDDEEKKEDEM